MASRAHLELGQRGGRRSSPAITWSTVRSTGALSASTPPTTLPMRRAGTAVRQASTSSGRTTRRCRIRSAMHGGQARPMESTRMAAFRLVWRGAAVGYHHVEEDSATIPADQVDRRQGTVRRSVLRQRGGASTARASARRTSWNAAIRVLSIERATNRMYRAWRFECELRQLDRRLQVRPAAVEAAGRRLLPAPHRRRGGRDRRAQGPGRAHGGPDDGRRQDRRPGLA